MSFATEPLSEPADVPPEGASPRRRALFAFIGAALVALVVIGAVGAFAFIRDRDFGDRGASAHAMPPDTDVYVDIDFGSLSDLDRLLQAFDGAFAQGGLDPSLDSLIDRLDEELRAEFGIGVDDVTPWVGRDLGIGVSGISATFAGGEPDLLLAVSVRNGGGADSFVQRMIGVLEDRDGLSFVESSYEGVTVYAADDAIEGQRVVVARSGDMLLVGNGDAIVRSAIDAQSGPSLADDAVMNDLLDVLPDGRAATVYLSPNLLDEVVGGLASLGAVGMIGDVPETEAGAIAMSLTLTDDGVQADVVSQTLGADSLAGQAAVATGSESLPARLPADTFVYVGIEGEDFRLYSREVGEAMDDFYAAFGPDIAEVESQLGFRLREDFLELLGRRMGFAMFPASSPAFGIPEAPEAGGMALIGAIDPGAIADAVARFANLIGGELPLESRDIGGDTLWTVVIEGSEVVVFGVAGEDLVIATDADDVAALDGDGPKLADDEFFQEAVAALPTSGFPLLFVDLQAALRTFEAPPDALEVLAPVRGMVAGSETTGAVARGTLLILIDY